METELLMGAPEASLVSAPWGGGARGSSGPTGQKGGTWVAGVGAPEPREKGVHFSPQYPLPPCSRCKP